MVLHFQSLAYFEITHLAYWGQQQLRTKKDTKGNQTTSVASMPLVTSHPKLTFICDHNMRGTLN